MALLDQLPLSPKQIRSIVESRTRRISCWSGAVRSGKTIASLLAFLVTVAEAPPSGLLIMSAKTLQTAERNLIEPLQDPALFGPLAAQVHHTRGSSVCTILGRTVHIIGAADARAESKLRGLSAYCILLDEATLLPEDYVAQALARCSIPNAKLLLTTNPAGPRHWLRQKYLLRGADLDLGHWHFTLDDNPFLDPVYVASLKRELTGVWYQRMILGLWVQAEGAIYESFDERLHVVDQLPPIARVLACGVDVGTTNPFAAVMLAVTQDGRLAFTREYRHDPKIARRQLTDAEFAVALRAWMDEEQARPERVIVDPSAESFQLQLRRDGVRGILDADNSVINGIRLMASLLSTHRLVVHRSCKGLIDEIPAYSWDDKQSELGIDKPLKVDDHSVDAARYALLTTQPLWRNSVPITQYATAVRTSEQGSSEWNRTRT